jgi:hypothetical protein
MRAVVFATQAAANGFSAAVDARLGYPKAGVNVGPGVHAPPNESVTVRHGGVTKHPARASWRYTLDAPVQAERGRGLGLPGGATEEDLDETWFEVP